MHETERAAFLAYAHSLRDLERRGATPDACDIKELSKAQRFLRHEVQRIIERRGGQPLRVATRTGPLEARLKHKKTMKPPTADILLGAFKTLNQDELNTKAAQLLANGDEGVDAVAGHLQDKIADRCSEVTPTAEVSPSVGDGAQDAVLGEAEQAVIEDFHRVSVRLAGLKKKRRAATQDLAKRCKEMRDNVCEVLDRTGTVTIKDKDTTLVFQLRRKRVQVPLKTKEVAAHFADAVHRMDPSSRSLPALQRPETMTLMIEEYASRVESNWQDKVDFELVVY